MGGCSEATDYRPPLLFQEHKTVDERQRQKLPLEAIPEASRLNAGTGTGTPMSKIDVADGDGDSESENFMKAGRLNDQAVDESNKIAAVNRSAGGVFVGSTSLDSDACRRNRSFPPPLSSLARKSWSQFPSQMPFVSLQPIRSHGRFVLQELKVPRQLMFRPIRANGRLILQLKYEEDAEDSSETEETTAIGRSKELAEVAEDKQRADDSEVPEDSDDSTIGHRVEELKQTMKKKNEEEELIAATAAAFCQGSRELVPVESTVTQA